MPLFEKDGQTIDYLEEGRGETVLLVHSSVSGNRQWRALVDLLKERYRVIAPNLFGYGGTTPWSGDSRQKLADQAGLALSLCEGCDQVHVVGHSFGGAVALKTASLLGSRAGSLVLYEPIPFYLLRQQRRDAAFSEIRGVRDAVVSHGMRGELARAAEIFADYWSGSGAWGAMPEQRQAAFMAVLPQCFHEWEAALFETATIEELQQITARTLVMHAAATVIPVLELVGMLKEACPHWSFSSLDGVGHMAPLTDPALVNPLISTFLDAGSNGCQGGN